jgi:N-acyl-D-aspartate/D-glutamate deacylase
MTTPKVKRLVKRLDELAPSVAPPRDLWPAIAQAITAHEIDQGETPARPQPQRRRGWWMPAAGMAAAVALVALGVVIGSNFGPRTDATFASGARSHNPDMIPASMRDAAFREQRAALMTEVQDRLQSMPEAEREKVAASLATLRRSITEIEAALGRDPANALLQELLVNSCQEEMRALTAVRDSGAQEI